MPGLEKKLARYPQFDSRIDFFHEFLPLGTSETRELLDQPWMPPASSSSRSRWTRIRSRRFWLIMIGLFPGGIHTIGQHFTSDVHDVSTAQRC
jgi:hypothetical protein